jgi:hypothetical protein
MPLVAGFVIDEINEDKFWDHGLSRDRVLQVLDNPWIIAPNRRERAGSYLIIGRDDGGCCIAVPITPTHDPLIWRPVTAWPCKDSEAARLPPPGRRTGRR